MLVPTLLVNVFADIIPVTLNEVVVDILKVGLNVKPLNLTNSLIVLNSWFLDVVIWSSPVILLNDASETDN